MFPEKRQAISYAQGCACFRSGEIRILDSSGNVERTIAFNETDRRLWRCDSRLDEAGNVIAGSLGAHTRMR